MNTSADFLKTISSSPMIKGSYSGIRMSPYASPFIVNTLGANSKPENDS